MEVSTGFDDLLYCCPGPIVPYVNKLRPAWKPFLIVFTMFARVFGWTLIATAIAMTLLLSFVSITIIAPYELQYKPLPVMLFVLVVGIVLLYNCVVHYFLAVTTKPIARRGDDKKRYCAECNITKCTRTHHCSVCKRCVLGMDHHCVWIGQCVGAHNHIHFFLFIFHFTLASLLVVLFGHKAFVNHYLYHENTYCSTTLVLLWEQLCYGPEVAYMIVFTYMACVLLTAFGGFYLFWNGYLISKGQSYIDYLQYWIGGRESKVNPKDWRSNIRNFFGLDASGRTLLQALFVPRRYRHIPHETSPLLHSYC